MKTQNKNRAFTLIELAIVLIIIGLITGGVVGAQSLIESAKRQELINQMNEYILAGRAFQLEYDALPGDMTDATQYWGAADGNDGLNADCINSVSHTQDSMLTCNGDGDERIDYYEIYWFWKHLSNAELISGSYTGINEDPGRQNTVINVNIPSGNYDNTGWYVEYLNGGDSYYYNMNYGNRLQIGYDYPAGTAPPREGFLSPKEAYQIDKKVDDGLPAKGNLIAFRWNRCDNTSGNTDFNSEYDLSRSDKVCGLIFKNAFIAN